MSKNLDSLSLLISEFCYLNLNEVNNLINSYESLEEVSTQRNSDVLPSFFVDFFALPTCPLVDSILSCYKTFLFNDFYQLITLFSGTPSVFVLKLLLISITECEDLERIKINHVEDLLSKISKRPASFIIANEDFHPAADGYISINSIFNILKDHASYIGQLTEVQNCFERMTLGNTQWQKIRHRRKYIRKAHEYAEKHNGKVLKESITSKIRRLFSREPPLFKYDYSLPFEKLHKAEDEIIKIYKQRYHPFVPIEKAEDRRLEALKRIGSIHSVEKPGTRMDFVVNDDVYPINYQNDDVHNSGENNNTNIDKFGEEEEEENRGEEIDNYNEESNNRFSKRNPVKSCTFYDYNNIPPPYQTFQRSGTSNGVFRNTLLSPPGCVVMPNEVEFHSPIGSPHGISPLVPRKSPIISLRKNPFCSDNELCFTINPVPSSSSSLILPQQQIFQQSSQFGSLSNKRYLSPTTSTSSSNVKGRSYSAANAYQQYPPYENSPIRIPISPPRSPTNSDSTSHFIASGSTATTITTDEYDLGDNIQSLPRNLRLSEDGEYILQQPQLVKVIQISPIKPRCMSYSNGEQIASVCSTMRGRKITLPRQTLEEDKNMQKLHYQTVLENESNEMNQEDDEYNEDDEDIDYDKYINSDKPKYKLTKNKDQQ